MTNKKRVQAVSVTTPVGIAKFPNLTMPDPHPDYGGDYKVFLVLDPENNPEHEAFLLKLEDLDESMYQQMLEVHGKKSLKREHYPVRDDVDAAGEETGMAAVTCKSKATFERNGKLVKRRLRFFDANQVEIKDPIAEFGGEVPYNSEIALRLMVTPYEMGGKFGITLRIADVQVVKKASMGPATAEECGFGSYEDGFKSDGVTSTEESVVVGSEEDSEPAEEAPVSRGRGRGRRGTATDDIPF